MIRWTIVAASHLVILGMLAAPSVACAATRYVLTGLPNPTGADRSIIASGINSYGQVVGDDFGGVSFLWTPNRPNGTVGSMTQLGGKRVVNINSYGQAVGCVADCSENQLNFIGQLWTPTTPNGTNGSWVAVVNPPNGLFTSARDVNSSGQVVGTRLTGPPSKTAFLWTPMTPNGTTGSVIDLGDIPGGPADSRAYGINSYGQVVGAGDAISPGFGRAILWTPTTPNGTTGSLTIINNGASYAWDINSMGQAVGANTSLGTAFLWTPNTPNATTGTLIDLGKLPGGAASTFARGINSQGDIVGGTSERMGSAFLWRPDVPNGSTGTMVNLQTLLSPADAAAWQLQEARGINDFGQIVGYAFFDPDGPGGTPQVARGFLLTPVPEPSAIWLAVASFISAWQFALSGRRRGASLLG